MPFLPRNPEHHTSDVVALHRATVENPFDDTPHLMYADAMDDAGASEEAHTLRRLVKLRAAIGTRPVTTPSYGEPAANQTGRISATNEAAIEKWQHRSEQTGPHIKLPDAEEVIPEGDDYRWHTQHFDRSLRIAPNTGGGVISRRTVLEGRRVSDPTERYTHQPEYHRAFIHSRDVKHLLGEHDAV